MSRTSQYADSSFLVSCFVSDTNTARAREILKALAAPLVLTALHSLEVRNALQLGVFRGLLTVAEADAAWKNVELDVQSGRLAKTTVKWPIVFRVAARLSAHHSRTIGTRSLDILHIAVAKTLRALEFHSFDRRQRALAVAAGLKIMSP